MLLPGEILNGYRVESILGRGGMATVYEATQLSLSRMVALKILAAELWEDDAFRERFRREGQVQALLEHPHIVTVFEAGESGSSIYIAMRVVRGPTLRKLIGERSLDAESSVRILSQVANALDYAHSRELVHRDVKPQNILVERETSAPHAYLADFGVTKLSSARHLTRTGQTLGTLDYISPEQILGQPTTAATDVYALAAVAYHCFTGAPLFAHEADAAVIYAHLHEPVPNITARAPGLSPALNDVFAVGLAKRPEERFASATALTTALEDAVRAPSWGHSDSRAHQPTGAGSRSSATLIDAVEVPPPLPANGGAGGRRPGEPLAPPTGPDSGTVFDVVDVPAPLPSLDEPAPRSRLRRWALGGLAVVLLAAAGTGYGAGRLSAPEPVVTELREGSFVLRLANGWRQEPTSGDAAASVLPGSGFAVTHSDGGTAAVAEVAPAKTGGFADRLPALESRPGRAVLIGPKLAIRYDGVRDPTGRVVQLYVLPQSTTAVAVACTPRSTAAEDSLQARCLQLVSDVRLRQPVRGPQRPSSPYGRSMAKVASDLTSAQSRARIAALTRQQQRQALTAVAASVERLATDVENVKAPALVSARHLSVVELLQGLEARYRGLVLAISEPREFARLREAVMDDNERLVRLLESLRDYGYASVRTP